MNTSPPKKRRSWQPREEDYLREHYATACNVSLAQALQRTAQAVSEHAAKLGLRKSRETIAENTRRAMADPAHGGRRTQFIPGSPPWNRNKSGSTGQHPSSRAHHFRPGTTNGRARALVEPLGTLRLNADGVLQRKVSNQPGASHLRWHSVHRLVWEAEHGPVPPGHLVVFKPGRASTDPVRITLDAVELVSRAENMRRNSVHANYPAELARLSQLRGVLSRQINRKQRAKEAQR